MDVPLIEQVKIQARILIPLIKALRAELGQERADAVVRKTLGNYYRKAGEGGRRRQHEPDLGQRLATMFDWFASGDALDYDVMKQTASGFDVNVTACRYAEFFHE